MLRQVKKQVFFCKKTTFFAWNVLFSDAETKPLWKSSADAWWRWVELEIVPIARSDYLIRCIFSCRSLTLCSSAATCCWPWWVPSFWWRSSCCFPFTSWSQSMPKPSGVSEGAEVRRSGPLWSTWQDFVQVLDHWKGKWRVVDGIFCLLFVFFVVIFLRFMSVYRFRFYRELNKV